MSNVNTGSLGVGRELGWKEQDWRIQDKEAWERGVCGPGGAGVMRAHCVACTLHGDQQRALARGAALDQRGPQWRDPPSRRRALPWLQSAPDHRRATQCPQGLLLSPPDLRSTDSLSQSRVCSSDVSFSAFFFIKSPPLLSLN